MRDVSMAKGGNANGSTQQQDEVPMVAAVLPSYYGSTPAETVIFDENLSVPVATEVDPLVGIVDINPSDAQNKDLSPHFRDVPFALFFLAHLGVLGWLAVDVAPKGYESLDGFNLTQIEMEIYKQSDDMTPEQFQQFEAIIDGSAKYLQVYALRIVTYLLIPSFLSAFMVAVLGTAFCIRPCALVVVYGCLMDSFMLAAIATITAAICSGSIFVWILSGITLVSILYYIALALRVVPFVAVNLKGALQGIGSNWGMYLVAFFFAKLGISMTIGWGYVVAGVIAFKGNECKETVPGVQNEFDDKCNPPLWVGVLFMLSLYWMITVTMNLLQITVAGVMATWCFDKTEAENCCSSAVVYSLLRSLTYSFGSVCMGSLLQAFISLFQWIVENAKKRRNHDDSCDFCFAASFFVCILECIANMLEELMYVFNQYAFIYAGIYGTSYIESGRRVMDLFTARGWTSVMSSNLMGYVATVTNVAVGAVNGLCAILIDHVVTSQLQEDHSSNASYLFGNLHGHRWWAFAIGFIIGAWISSIMMECVKAAVNTLIVCCADSPTVLEMNHPELMKEMSEAWAKVFPEIAPISFRSSPYGHFDA